MRRVGSLLFIILFAAALSIPVFLLEAESVFANSEEPIKDKNGKEIVDRQAEFKNDHETDAWSLEVGSQVRLKLRYHVTNQKDNGEGDEITIILRKQNEDGKFVDTDQKFKRNALDDKDQEDIVFENLKKGETYKIFFDGKWRHLSIGKSHSINYSLYLDHPKPDGYDLKGNYKYNRGDDDELTFSIVNKNNDKVHFNGEVKYEIIPDVGEKIEKVQDITSKDGKSFKIEDFTNELLPAEKELSDNSVPKTQVVVKYAGTVDSIDGSSERYYLTQVYEIKRYKRDLEVEKKTEGNKVTVSAKTKLGDGVKDRKWSFVLKDKEGEELATKKPKDEGRKAKASFSHDDFKGKKSGNVHVTYTGKMEINYGKGIALYRNTGKVKVDAPAAQDDQGGPRDDGPNGPREDGPKDDDNKDDQQDDDKKDQDQKDKDKNQDKQDDQQKDQDQQNDDKKDQDQKDKDQDQDKQDDQQKDDNQQKEDQKDHDQQQDKDQNQQDDQKKNHDPQKDDDKQKEQINEEAQLEIRSNVLREEKKVAIDVSLQNVDQPEGDWKLVFRAGEPDEEVVEETQSKNDTLKKEFSIEKIEKDTVKVVATFKGKDKKGKIDVSKEEEINLNESKSEEEEIIEKVVNNVQTPNNGQIGGKLPKTATQYGNSLLIGILFLLAGGVLFLIRRRLHES